MAREWILNSVTSRFQLNFKRNVGPTSESIRKCAPKNIKQWRTYYFNKVRPKEHIHTLGKRLYEKINEVVSAEVKEITEEDCINYMLNLVIERTYDGYTREIQVIYEQLEKALGQKISQASDEWDRRYNVDFYISVGDFFLGLQIKPVDRKIQLPQIYKERNIQVKTHEEFRQKYGGRVFYVYSITDDSGRKVIANEEVIDVILAEIRFLKER